jgi:hypothetical protein
MVGIDMPKFSLGEIFILEAEFFICLYEELKDIFRAQYKNYFKLMRFNTEKEDAMLEANFLRFVINDILVSEEYSLEGIAYYTQIPEDVICDVVAGNNSAPSLQLTKKIIDLHRSVRPTLYRETMKKIVAQYLISE